jgi:hypothetical protein
MVCPCCVPPPPPCDPCYECDFPQDKQENTVAPVSGQCAVNYFPPGGDILESSVAKVYLRRPNPLPGGLTWKAGAQAEVSNCNWCIVVDEAYKTCCCAIPVELGQTFSWIVSKTRYRLLIIVCPEGEPATMEDRTSDYLDGDFEQESDDIPEDGLPGGSLECLQPPECYEMPDFLPDDDEPVCNEFP